MKYTHGQAVQSDSITRRHADAARNWACNMQKSEGADLSLSLSKELAKSSKKTNIPVNFY